MFGGGPSATRRFLVWALSVTWSILNIGNFVQGAPYIPPDPISVVVNSAFSDSVSVSVVFPTREIYDVVRVKVHSLDGVQLVSSGSTPSNLFTTSSAAKTFNITSLSTPLMPGEQYTVEVQALYRGRETNGVFSNDPVTVKPSTPYAVTAFQADNERIKVNWTHRTGRADKFVITVTPNIGVPSFEKAVLVDTNETSLEYEIPNQPTKGQTYVITVTAVSYDVSSDTSSDTSLTTIPSDPISVGATETDAGKINVTWTQGDGRVDKFVVTVKPEIGGLSAFDKIIPPSDAENFGANQELLIPNQPVQGGAYIVVVRALSNGVPSDDVAADMPVFTKPANPMGVYALETSPGSVEVFWMSGGGCADRFIVTVNPAIEGQTEFEKTVPESNAGFPDANQQLIIPNEAVKGYTYNVSVRTVSNGVPSDDVRAAASLTVKPSNSSSVEAIETSNGTVNVIWTQGVGRVDKFVVTVNPPIGGNSTFEKVVPAANTEDSGATQELVVPGQPIEGNAYNVTVIAVSNDVQGDPVEADLPVYTKPSNPRSVEAVETSGKIRVTWTHGGGYAQGFVITVSPTINNKSKFFKNVTISSLVLATSDQELVIPDQPTKGQTYTVTVTSVSNEISSDDIPAASSVTTKPSNPSSVSTVETSAGKVHVTWAHDEGLADRFVVTISPPIGNTSEFVKEVPAQNVDNPGASQELVIPSQPTKGETYTVTVRAESNGVRSDEIQGDSVTTKPSNPSTVVAREVKLGELQVSWTHGGGRADTFVITVDPAIGNQTRFEKIIQPSAVENPSANQSLVLPGPPTRGLTYRVMVRAVSSGVSSDNVSASEDITIRPSQPSSVMAQETVLGKINVTWTQGKGRIDTFVVTVNPSIDGHSSFMKIMAANSMESPGTQQELVVPIQPVKGITYNVTVRAESNGVPSTDVISKPITTKPSKPISVRAIETKSGKIQVSWTHGSGRADQFVVTVNSADGNSSQYVKTVPSGSADDPGDSHQLLIPYQPTKGQTYTITVRAESNGELSDDVPATNLTTKPSNPSSVVAAESSLGMIEVNWTHDEGRADTFVVTVNPAIGHQSSFEKPIPRNDAENPDSSQELVIPRAPVRGQTYTVRVRALSYGVSSDDVPASAAITVAPPTPTDMFANTSAQDMTIQVHWSKGEGIVTAFIAKISKGDWQEEVIQDPTSTSRTFTLPDSGEYTVIVKAQSGDTNSTESDPLTVLLATPPVILSVVNKTSRTAELSWERKDSNVKNYRLQVTQTEIDVCILDVLFHEAGSKPQPSDVVCRHVENQTFGASEELLTYKIDGLAPCIEYLILVSLQTVGLTNETELTSMILLTDAEVPQAITNTSLTVEGPEEVTLCWSRPEPKPGPTNYTVTVADHGQNPKADIVIVVPGYENNCSRVRGLEQFWPYVVDIRAVTDAGAGPATDPIPFRTAESAPGKVQNFKVQNSTSKVCTVDITWEAPAPRDRNANITAFTLLYQYQGPNDLGTGNITSLTIPWSGNQIYSRSVTFNPEHNYIFTVYAHSADLTGDTSSVIFTTSNTPTRKTRPHCSARLIAIAAGSGILAGLLAVVIDRCLRERSRKLKNLEAAEPDSYSDKVGPIKKGAVHPSAVSKLTD